MSIEKNLLTEKDFSQIHNYLVQVLPQLLRQQPEIVATIEGIIADQFPRRDEFARLLDELKAQHKETRLQIKQIDRRIELVEMRLEQVDQRFDKVDQRFDKVDQRLDEQHRDNLELKRRMIKVESTVDRMDKRMIKFDAWLRMNTGNLGDEKGKALEQLFALGLSYGLKNRDILPETIQLRQQYVDTEGLIYLNKGKWIEVDIIAEDGTLTLFEVKASAVATDVDIFARKVKLIQLHNKNKQVQGIFISLGAGDEVKECCREYHLTLLD